MPALTRRQQILAATQMASSDQTNVASYDAMGKHLWVVDDDDDFESPQKETDFTSLPLSKVPSRKDSTNNLRISTYPKPDLHERYMSSEEEASPSPDSETESTYGNDSEEGKGEQIKHNSDKNAEKEQDEPIEVPTEEYQAEIAVAVPIMAMGRPKLVDIHKLAPMHKRKRSSTDKAMPSRAAPSNVTARLSSPLVEGKPSASQDFAIDEEQLPNCKESNPVLAPDTWLPEDDSTIAEEDEHYYPELKLRRPPSYIDYDPYSLNPPRLSPRNSYNGPAKKPGSVARARKLTAPRPAMNNSAGFKGLTRTLSLAKRQEAYHPTKQITRKPKMLARGATERTEMPMIPPFPSEDDKVPA